MSKAKMLLPDPDLIKDGSTLTMYEQLLDNLVLAENDPEANRIMKFLYGISVAQRIKEIKEFIDVLRSK